MEFLSCTGWTFLQIIKNENMKMRVSNPENNQILEGCKTVFKLFCISLV